MKNGKYELILAPDDFPGLKYRGKYAYEHTVVWWIHHGRVPKEGFTLHHINGNHRDNRIENLRQMSRKEHSELHGLEKSITVYEFECSNCGKQVQRDARLMSFKLKHGQEYFYCGRKCMGKQSKLARGEV